MKYWEIIADNLSKAGWSWGCVSAIDSQGRTIWILDAHRDDGKRFVVLAEDKLTAFIELESAIRGRSLAIGPRQRPVVMALAWRQASSRPVKDTKVRPADGFRVTSRRILRTTSVNGQK
jgi:hypothetical protein